MTKSLDQSVDSISCKLLIYEQDSVWLVKYTNMNDKYGLPGGRLMKGETIEEAVEREAAEEIGVEVKNFSPAGVNLVYADSGRDGQDCLELYFVAEIGGRPRKELSVDGELAELVELSRIDSIDIANRYSEQIKRNSK